MAGAGDHDLGVKIESVDYNVAASSDQSPENGMRKKLEEEFKKAEVELKKEKSNWIRQKVIYSSLWKVLRKLRWDAIAEIDDDQLGTLNERIIQAESKLCSQNAPTMRQCQRSSGEIDPDTEETLRFLIEKDIQGTCEQVLKYHDNLDFFHCPNRKVFEARATKLGEILVEEKRKLEMCYREICDAQGNEKQLYSTCMKGLYQSAEILAKIIEKFRIKLQPEVDDEKASNIIARCEATSLKAENMNFGLQKEVYIPKSIAALKVIRDELVNAERLKHQEIVCIEQQLTNLRNVGDEFNAIVEEYSRLQTDIEKHKWALEKFRS